MSEANDEVINDVTDVTEENDTTDEGTLTVDDYRSEKARRIKAEKTLVEQKRKLKELESKSSDIPSDIMTKADYAMEKFLDKNPELSEYTKELSEYTKKGISLEEAKTLVLNSDKAKANREKTNSLGLSDWDPSFTRTSISKDELGKLSQSEYNKVMADVDSGKVKLK